VAGRAGRGPKGGDVIIQTRMPSHHAVRHALAHDFLSFVREEIGNRRVPIYPPFVSLANVVVSGVEQDATATTMIASAQWIHALVARAGLRDIVLVGPAPCPIDRIKDRWRWHLLIKSTRHGAMTRLARYIAERCPVPKHAELRLVVDRDPVSLL